MNRNCFTRPKLDFTTSLKQKHDTIRSALRGALEVNFSNTEYSMGAHSGSIDFLKD